MQGRDIPPKNISHPPARHQALGILDLQRLQLALALPANYRNSIVKEHTSDASTPWLRLPAQCPVLFGSVEILCELVTLGHSEENIRPLDLCQSAGGMVRVQVLCWRGALGCRPHALGAGSSRAQASCLQHLIFLLGPAGSQCNTSLQDLLCGLSAECLGATGKVPVCLWL